MGRHVRKMRPKIWITLGLAMWIAAVATATGSATFQPPPFSPQQTKPASAPKDKQQPAPSSKAIKGMGSEGQSYVGEKKCLECHDDMRKGYHGSPHYRSEDARTPAATQGCESCHGPGSKHVEDPGTYTVNSFKTLPPEESSAVCTTCHNRGPHALWDGSQHNSRRLTCTTCHSVHEPKSREKQLKTVTELETCAQCHRDKIAKLDRSGHMPVREGKMSCSTCHNVHGATNVRLLKKGDSIAELCTSCHADKRGPWLWEHPPSRDGCVTCHDPHGSSNERMLVAKPPILCQRCHTHRQHPSTIYDGKAVGAGSSPNIRVYARSCVTCHSAIHGSNHPSGQRFVR